MAPVAAGGVPAFGDGAGGNLMECFCRFKSLNCSLSCARGEPHG